MIDATANISELPLNGKTVLVTRAAGQSSRFSAMLRQVGAAVVEMPALEICPPSSWDSLDRAIAHLADFDWLVLTSANGVNFLCDRLSQRRGNLDDLMAVNIAVVGKKTATALQQRGLRPDFIPPHFVADDLAATLPLSLTASRSPDANDSASLCGVNILFPRVERGGRDVLVRDLTRRGAAVTEVAAYQSRCPEAIASDALTALQAGTIDVITFASSKTVRCFCRLIETATQARVLRDLSTVIEPVWIASIGPQTSHTCRQLLGRVNVEAAEYTLDGLIQALIDYQSRVESHSPDTTQPTGCHEL